MELRQLRYFVKIADMGSMSRAALALHISQPSLSQQISQLEDEMGKPLLIRLPTGVRMTVEGEVFYRQALQILRQVDEVRAAVTAANEHLTGRVTIAMAHTQTAQYALPLILEARKTYPQIDLEVFDNTSSDLLHGVASGRRDLGLLINEDDAALLDSEPVLEEEILLISHPSQVPASSPVLRSELATLTLAVPAPEQVSRAQIEAIGGVPAEGGLKLEIPKNWIVANSAAIVRQAVLRGVAHAFQPWGAVRDELTQGLICATPILPRFVRTVYLSSARGANASEATRAIRQLLMAVVQEQIDKGFSRARYLSRPCTPPGT
ncbi:LysR family transcriptional regulator [Variovorax ureilyticus]|uniref:LysR family transcriptional regulator n=1 Tax=Variovorax ureilyticus TaxID=1836198 RepID=A0ABU8VL66_9BURK